VDRHRAIRHPLRARLTARQLAAAFVVIWTAALALPFPVAALSRVVTLTKFRILPLLCFNHEYEAIQ